MLKKCKKPNFKQKVWYNNYRKEEKRMIEVGKWAYIKGNKDLWLITNKTGALVELYKAKINGKGTTKVVSILDIKKVVESD